MRVLVAYESVFGATREVAEAVAGGIRRTRADAEVTCGSVTDLPVEPIDADLLVVGGPTHFWGPTSWLSREMRRQYENRIRPAARRRAPPAPPRPRTTGVRDWLTALPTSSGAAAAFDTRIEGPLTGGAAAGIARRLRRLGRTLVVQPEGFFVDAVPGPLRAGERERAEAWATSLITRATPTIRTGSTEDRAAAGSAARWETVMNSTSVLHTEHAPSGARSTLLRPAPDHAGRPALDLTRVLTTTEIVVGAVLVARELARRPGSSKAMVTMGPGGWVSMRGGTVAVRPARHPLGRPRPIPASSTAVRRVPLWARVISAVPLQRLVA